jgi:RND family efflux transporter MFP subunit
LYITFSTLPKTNDVWTIDVPSPITNGYLSGSQNLTETSQQNAITLTAKQQSIENAKINLASAQSAYDDTIVTSPIDGQVGQLSVTEGQTINSGATVATLVTDKLFADIPLNEVDVAKVHQGDKVTATFDAISDLTLTGRVLSIDLVGTVTQGVVNYNVKIVFDTEDARVKSGMSISVAIATAVHQDVLIVPSSAVKTSGGASYVLSATSATDPAPTQIPVTVGLSDDMNTEILSGLKEGDSVVTKTTTTSNKSSTTTAPSILSSVGGNARGATRAIGR